MKIERVAEDLNLITGFESSQVASAVRALSRELWPGVKDVTAAWSTLAVYGQPAAGWQDWVHNSLSAAPDRRRVHSHVIEVCYELGQDGPGISAQAGMDFDQMVKLHSETPVECLAVGFQPGFGYLGPVAPALACVPRRNSPRGRVAAGSVALAAGHTAVYPSSSPGGWNLIGMTRRVTANAERGYFGVQTGDLVRFVPVSLAEYQSEQASPLQRVWISADVGEGMPWEREVLAHISAANIGLGEHAGNELQTHATIAAASKRGCLIGMHPGYPDREGFGRRSPNPEEQELWLDAVVHQMVKWAPHADWDFIKPHGALFHDLASGEVWDVFGPLIESIGLPLVGLRASRLPELAAKCGVPFWPEGYAERGMRPDGSLIPRGEPGSELHSEREVVDQSLAVAHQMVKFVCLHGDRPDAPALASAVRSHLMENGFWSDPDEPASP